MSAQTVSHAAGVRPISRPIRTEVVLLAGLVGLTLISRLVFASHTLYHFDSVNFALALEHYDVRIDQPQVPGYILYVWIGQLFNGVVHDPNAAYTWLSVVGSALAVAAMWALGRTIFGPAAGWAAALLLASSPLFWFYGEIALPHSLDLLGVSVSVWLLYEIRQGRAERLPWAAIALGLSGGLRPQTLVFLAPLILFSVWRAPRKRLGLAMLLLGAVCLAWLAPLLISVGGLGAYLQLMAAFSSAYQDSTSIFRGAGLWGLSRNAVKLAQYAAYAWGAGLIPIGLWLVSRFRPRQYGQNRRSAPSGLRTWFGPSRERFWFIVIWGAPALGFYTLIHMGQQGLVFVFLPALLLMSAEACVEVSRRLGRRALHVIVMSMVALNALVFVFAPEFPMGSDSVKLLTRATIERQDRDMQARVDAIRTTYAPNQAILIAAQWRHVEYYLPEFKTIRFGLVNRWEREGGLPVARPGDERVYRLDDLQLETRGATIVLFDPELAAYVADPASISDGPLLTMPWTPDRVLWIAPDGFGLKSRS